jgi:hypothetical protein
MLWRSLALRRAYRICNINPEVIHASKPHLLPPHNWLRAERNFSSLETGKQFGIAEGATR